MADDAAISEIAPLTSFARNDDAHGFNLLHNLCVRNAAQYQTAL